MLSHSHTNHARKYYDWDKTKLMFVLSSPRPEGVGLSREQIKPFEDLLEPVFLNKIVRDVDVSGVEEAAKQMFELLKFGGRDFGVSVFLVCYSIADWIELNLIPHKQQIKVPEIPPLMSVERFKSLLSATGIQRPIDAVINKILNNFILRFHSVFSPESALALYDFVNDLPSTTIRAKLEEDYGIRLNGLDDSSYGNSNIITGANQLGEPVLIKLLIGNQEDISREVNVIETLSLATPCQGIVQIKICSVFVEGNDYRYRFSNGKYNCLLMPHYPRSLALLEKLLSFEVILKGGMRIKKALEFIHENGLVHMDVKPANIFVATSGEWYLGDFGSCVKIGESIVSTSECYLPMTLFNIGKACPSLDFFMLGTSLVTLFVDLKKIWKENEMRVDLTKLHDEIELIVYEPLKHFIHELIKDF